MPLEPSLALRKMRLNTVELRTEINTDSKSLHTSRNYEMIFHKNADSKSLLGFNRCLAIFAAASVFVFLSATPAQAQDSDDSSKQNGQDQDLEAQYQELLKNRPDLKQALESGRITKETIMIRLRRNSERGNNRFNDPNRQNAKKSPDDLAMQKLRRDVGNYDFTTKINLAAIGDPKGGIATSTGTAESQMALSDAILISRAITNTNDVMYAFNGYRTDTKMYYSIGIDGKRTSIGYLQGNYDAGGVRTLKDPFDGTTAVTTFNKNGVSDTIVRIGTDQTEFLNIVSTPVRGKRTDLIKAIMSLPIKPEKINRTTNSKNPAENFSPEHLKLQKFAGNFTQKDGTRKFTGRIVCEGRFLIGIGEKVNNEDAMLMILGFDSAKKIFQMVFIEDSGAKKSIPIYGEGTANPDGLIVFKFPELPKRKDTFQFSENGDINITVDMGDFERTMTLTPNPTDQEKPRR